MKTLDEYNAQIRALHEMLAKKGADVACPKCGAEMIYSTQTVAASNPPKRHVVCPKCKHSGFKL